MKKSPFARVLLRLSVSFSFLALSAWLSETASAQDTPSPSIFSEVVDVRVVNLEAVVTDRQGNRVTGLSAADFKLTIDGKDVPIEYFNEIQGGTAIDPGAVAPQGGLPTLQPGKPVSTSYLVFIDDFFPLERDRNRVLESLRGELPLLNPEDRMAVVAYDGKRLSMVTSWSQSQEGLDQALKKAALRPAFGLQRLADQRRLLPGRPLGAFERVGTPLTGLGNRLSPEERDYARLLTEQVGRTVSAAAATLRSFAQPPGRKVMLLLSGGWPFDPSQVAAEDKSIAVLDSEFDRGFEIYRPLADTANLLGYTLYPVDVPGLQQNLVDASAQSPRNPNAPAAISDEQEAHGSLTYLADRTGGRAMLNSRRAKALGEAATDTRSYYWIGFAPTRQRDDKAHKIKLDVTRPGLSIRNRAGFLDYSRQVEVSAMVESTLLFGEVPLGPTLPVQLGTPKKTSGGRMEVALTVGIPVDAVTVLPVGEKFVSEVELRIATLDEDGNRAEIPVIPLRFENNTRPESGGLVRYDTTVRLRRKKNELLIAIYDPASGRLVSTRVEVNPR